MKSKIKKEKISEITQNKDSEGQMISKRRPREKGNKNSLNETNINSDYQIMRSINTSRPSMVSTTADNQIIISKKEIFDILKDINLDDHIIYKKKESEDSNSIAGSVNSEVTNINYTSKQSVKMMIKTSPSQERERPAMENQSHPSLHDAGSGAVTEMVKMEESPSPSDKQNILRLILGDIHQCQYSEIFKIFAKEINNPITLDYFVKLKESLVKEETERLLNMMVFIVWSLRFMRIDPNLMRTCGQFAINSNSFMIRGEDAIKDGRPLNFNSSSGQSAESYSLANSSEGVGHLEQVNMTTPNFTFHHGCNPFAEIPNPESLVDNPTNLISNNSGSSKSASKMKCLASPKNEMPKENEKEGLNSNPLQGFNSPYPLNSNQMIAMPVTGPNGNFFLQVPLTYFQGNLNPNNSFTPINSMNIVNTMNIPHSQVFTPPVNINTIPSHYSSSMNTSSYFKTEVVKSGQLQLNSHSQVSHLEGNSHSLTPKKFQNTYDQMLSLNDSNYTLSSLLNNCVNNSNSMSNYIKRENDVIDITISEDKPLEEDFEKVYREIVSIFSKPSNEETFIKLKRFMHENQVRKIEEVVRKNPFSYLDKRQYILLYRTTKEELYLKIDPTDKKYSITRSVIRKSTSKSSSKLK